MGIIYVASYLEKYEEARAYAKQLLEMARDEEAKHIALHQTGMVERMAGDYQCAMDLFLQEAEVIAEAFLSDDLRVAANLYEQAYCKMKMAELLYAMEMMQRALKHAIKSGDEMCIGCAYRGLGEIMRAIGSEKEASEYFEHAIEAFEKAGDIIAVEEIKAMM